MIAARRATSAPLLWEGTFAKGDNAMTNCTQQHHNQHSHTHGSNCGHIAVHHNGHVGYLHDGHLHHVHDGHCDDHGPVQTA